MRGKSLRHVFMVAKFLDFNKPWSCKLNVAGKKKRKIDTGGTVTFLRMIALWTKTLALD